MRLVYPFILLVLLFSCAKKNKTSDNILQPSKMKVVLWDMFQANALAEEIAKKDSAKKMQIENINLQGQVFAIHKISKDNFYKSYDFYSKHPELMMALLDSTIAYAALKHYNINGNKDQLKLDDSLKLFK